MAKVSRWNKFMLLMWKNWILQWNNKCQLAIELMLPAVLSLFLVQLRMLVHAERKEVTIYPPVEIDNLDLFNKSIISSSALRGPKYELLYSPTNSYLDQIVKDAAGSLNLVGYTGYPNASALEFALTSGHYLAGVQFDDVLANITSYPTKFSFALRFPSELRTANSDLGLTWMTMKLFFGLTVIGPRHAEDNDGGVPVGYLREGFLPVQDALSMAYVKLAGNVSDLPIVEMQRYPYPEFIYDPLLEGLSLIMSLFILLSYIYPCACITKYITIEKEKQLKEVMKIMGLHNWIHWTAWFVKSFVMLGISAILISILIKIKFSDDVAVLTYSSWSAILFFLLIYIISSIFFCFMMATFFSKASTAAAVTGIVLFIAYIPYSSANRTYDELSLFDKLFRSLLSNTAMGFGIKLIFRFEGTGEGFQWSNMFTPVSVDDDLTMGAIMLMMLVSSIMYMLICLYLEQIFPGDFGIPKKWYFLFTSKFWLGEKKKEIGVQDVPNGDVVQRNPDAFEEEPSGKNIGVQVKHLKKKFADKLAVNDLSINMYEDEITVLLGHNGAGKTTTISMLTGMFPPTAGTAIINGSDIRSNIEGARSSLGICPQHNVLFDEMSVANHIVFFSRLKGLKGDAIKREVSKYLKEIQLEKKAKVDSCKLSGGMKRKLSLCCALCGDTKVVLCDEPSSGMDPAARRQLWDLLQAEKIGRTILLTTHFMDEADILGDRIAIMCGGELKCHGTSFFLKKKYGSGYHLICVKRENCNVAEVTALLNKYIPDMQPESDIGAELAYQLPDSYASVFEEMFRALEENSDVLNLDGYGVGITSMEEVFMKVGAESASDGSRKQQSAIMSGGSGYSDDDVESVHSDRNVAENTRLLKGCDLFRNQWHAMFLKKFLHTSHNKLLFLIQNFIGIYFVIITIIIARKQGTFKALPAMTISLSQYPIAVTIMETVLNIEPNSLEAKIADEYKAIANSYGKDYTYLSTEGKSFSDYILELGQTSQVRINSRYVTAATVAKGKITAWLNNQPLHTAPLSVNLVYNAMAKVIVGPDAEISVTIAPLPYTTEKILSQIHSGNNLGPLMAQNLCFCMCYVSAFYIIFVIKERESRSKLLQFVGGVRVWTFWLTQILWDLTTYALTAVLIIITMACLQESGFATFEELGRCFLILVIFGCAMLPFTYLISFMFIEPATGFVCLSIINIITGMALFIVIVVMSIEELKTKDLANLLQWFFRIAPHFSLAMSLNKVYTNLATRNACNNDLIATWPHDLRCQLMPICCNTTPYLAWNEPGILPEILYMVVTAVVFFLIIIASEFRLVNELIYNIRKRTFKPAPPPEDGYFDEDVNREKERILAMSNDEIAGQNLVLDRVTKYYGKFVAVNEVSLCVKQTECFGLLGVNGAGKTTTFKMMTGDERITSGSAYVKGMSLASEMNKIYKEIGYCPQFDALLDDLTGRETLKIFCLLRGIRSDRINQISEELGKSFGFMKHMDKKTKAYSGGNKRKLSTAIAVIGSPTVIYLDEPTAGMDPAARRQLWNMVCRIRDAGKSIILTSHSMDECEALCTRLAIMVNGEFKCIGSTQHLKNKFSKGLILKIKVRRDIDMVKRASKISLNSSNDEGSIPTQIVEQNSTSVKEFVESEFPQAKLKEEYQGILTFYIPLSTIRWSQIFGLMERNREQLNVEDYTISQTTLEEIFLEFAKYQREDKRGIN